MDYYTTSIAYWGKINKTMQEIVHSYYQEI